MMIIMLNSKKSIDVRNKSNSDHRKIHINIIYWYRLVNVVKNI